MAFTLQSTHFSIFDIGDRTKPVLLSQTPAFGCLDILVDGTRAFVAMDAPSIVVFDISPPAKPVRLAEWTGTFRSQGLAFSGDRHQCRRRASILPGGSAVMGLDV